MTATARFDITATDRTQAAFASVKKSLSTIERAFGGMKTAIVSIIGSAGLGALIKDSIDLGDNINALSKRLGASTEALSQYRYAAKLSNIEFETLTKTWEDMQKNIALAAMGTGRAKDYIKQLGIDAKEFVRLRPEEQFERLADKLAQIPNPSERAAYAFRIMGSNGIQMLQMMTDGSQGMRELRDEADKLGLTITRDMADKMDNANDQFDKMKLAFGGLGLILATELAPLIIQAGEVFLRAVQWIKEHKDVLADLAKLLVGGAGLIGGLKLLSLTVSGVELAFMASAAAAAKFMEAFKAAGAWAAFTTSLNGVSVAAMAATGTLGTLKVAAGTLFSAFAGWQIGTWLYNNFQQARIAGLAFIGGLLKAWEMLKLTALGAWTMIEHSWDKTIAAMKSAFGSFLDFVASGLSKLPYLGGAADSLSQYAQELKTSSASTTELGVKLTALGLNYAQATTEIDNHIDALIGHQLSQTKATEATQQQAQINQLAGLSFGELGKRQQEVNKLLEEGKRLTEELRTPMEVYQDNIDKINLLLEKGHITQETYNRALAKFGKEYEDASGITEKLEKQKQAYEEHVKQITGIFQNAFFAFMDEGFDGMVKSFSNALKAMAAEAAAAELGKLLFGSIGGNLGGGGLLNQFLGDGMGKLFGFGGFRAGGGSVQTGKSYVVGEKEPELFTPSASGFITPLSKLGSSKSTTIVINNNIQTPNAESFRRAEGNLTARMKMQLDRAGRRNL